MPRVQSEYYIEKKLIERLESIGYQHVDLRNYCDVIANARALLAAINAKRLMEINESP